MSDLNADKISVAFAGLRALSEVDLKVTSGQIVGLIGPNGAGKTTLVNVLTGFQAATEGFVRLDGQSLSGLKPHEVRRRGVARTFQGGRLFRDLAVIDWDASLVIDLDGYVDDVLYVLELANLQLEEFRIMDERLDRHLERAYRDLERARSVWGGGPTGMLAWLRRFRVDATKLADEVTHITKFFGDWYLARLYLGAKERFHLAQWQQSVEQRLGQLDEVYRVIQSDVYERRMLWL